MNIYERMGEKNQAQKMFWYFSQLFFFLLLYWISTLGHSCWTFIPDKQKLILGLFYKNYIMIYQKAFGTSSG